MTESGRALDSPAAERLRRRFGGGAWLTPWPALAIALAGVALIGLGTHRTDPRLSFSILYVVPIVFATIHAGGRAGMSVAVVSAAVWLFVALNTDHPDYSMPALYWNAAVRLGFFMLIAYLLDALLGTIARLEASGEALRRSEARFRDLFEQASDAIFIADLGGRYTDVNAAACRLLGYERGELVGKRIVDLIPAEDAERLARSRQEMLAGGHDRTEWSLRHRDGRYIPIEISAEILPDGIWLALVRDITARKREEERARKAAQELERRVEERSAQLRVLASELAAVEDRERRQIARDLHDDLGQTLAAARIRLAALRRNGADAGSLRAIDELIARADRATRSLAAQLAPPALYELGLVPALEWLADELGDSYGLDIDVIDDGAPKPLTQAARAILFRAVRELLINVAKHAQVDAATVETARVDDRLRIRVNDAGVGFEPTRIESAPHGGLGLASVRERLTYLGGTVAIESIPGDGTVVELMAPLEPEPASAAAERTR